MIWQAFKDTVRASIWALLFMAAGALLVFGLLPAFGGGQ